MTSKFTNLPWPTPAPAQAEAEARATTPPAPETSEPDAAAQPARKGPETTGPAPSSG
ncbi:hypothetical protein [Streptomyces sp. NPDC048638]|uniref:hypothetical protein n=1 Tax=Streptomyces sp. NPDC048638 TaxID=3365580 RepID=UPI00371EF44F